MHKLSSKQTFFESFLGIKQHGRLFFFVMGLIGIDQVVKFIALKNLRNPLVFTSSIQLVLVKNQDLLFGLPNIFSNLGIIFVHIVLIGGFLWFVSRDESSRCIRGGLSLRDSCQCSFFSILIVSGGIGNLIDRIIHGFVVDYIALSFWPVFNLADIYLTLGLFGVVLNSFFQRK